MGSFVAHRREFGRDQSRPELTRRELLAVSALGLIAGVPGLAHAAGPENRLTWGIHVSLAPTWFDPAETPGIITPFMILYAVHDALVKPMPGQPLAPCLAESFTAAEDGRSYEFVLRQGVKFHNGDPVIAEDVKFSFERYRGASHSLMQDRVAAIETPDPQHIRFNLKAPWPDFLTFYATATGAGWIVPKKYVEKVGDEGFKKSPIGAGPYKFVSFTPGVELVFEAFDQYWRKTPSVKQLIFKVVPEESTRLAALKDGEVDIVYSIRGELAEELRSTPGLTLKPVNPPAPFWLYFADQWDPKSPWHDERVRRAANLAIDRKTINEALTLGFSKLTNSLIPASFEFYWQPPPAVFDQAKARQLLAEAGYAGGFDAGDYYCDSSYSNVGEAVLNNLQEVGIRSQLRPIERAAFLKGWGDKAYNNLIQCGSGAFGNAATRLGAFIVKGGTYVYGSYPDIDALAPQQAAELDHKRRAAILEKMQQLVHEKSVVAPIWQLAFINGAGPRVGESGFGLITDFAYTAPYEDITIKAA
ncbi:MAG: ABC transporter substrate-binding protein [Alphaproteobacteria bacterium]|nr:ABC transporter substrate-binding protein [Alphaproteobacteria bacterium]